jgi:hypothetical protein
MTKLKFTLQAAALVIFTLTLSSMAQAQATRTWVSGVGDDVNPCSRTAPCKTYAGAISKTAAGGEISVLDPGGYGTLTATKSITVDGGTGAGWGSTLASATNGFIINDSLSGTPGTIKVILRNLSINGAGTTLGVDGIRFLRGAELTVENVVIQNFSGDAIDIAQAGSSTTNIRNVTTDNVGVGVKATTTVGEAIVLVDNCRFRAVTEGVHAISNGRVTVRDSVITLVTTGIRTSGSNSIINTDDNFVAFCTTAIQASAGSSINVSDSIIAQNATGVSANGGTVNSFQGNSLINNTSNGAFSGSTVKQ